MKKSSNITKYNLKWQMVRSKIKGSSVPLNNKLKLVNNYFEEEKTIDAYERVLNYLEGLQMGYRAHDQKAVGIIDELIKKYKDMDTLKLKKEMNSFIDVSETQHYSYKERLDLWKDLFNRNKKWLQQGYTQKEINDFMDILYLSFADEHIQANYSMDKLENLRRRAQKLDNTHKFFF
jgi:hypothetical protein